MNYKANEYLINTIKDKMEDMNMKFEYMTLKVAQGVIFQSKKSTTVNLAKAEDLEKALNELGADGWELIQIIGTDGFLGAGDSGHAILKRQVN